MRNANIIFALLILVAILASSVSNEPAVDEIYSYTSVTIFVTALSVQTEAEIKILARIAQGEAIGEGILGMTLVMETVINRMHSNKWPNTIQGVVTQRSQFNGYRTTNYNKVISNEVLTLATSLLLGKKSHIFPTSTYWFYNPAIATNHKFITYIRSKYQTNRSGRHEYAY